MWNSATRALLAAAFAPLEEIFRLRTVIEREARQPNVILGHAFQKIFGKRLQVLAKRSQTSALHAAPESMARMGDADYPGFGNTLGV